MDVPFGAPPSIDEHIKLIWDLQLLAFQADITRVSALLFTRETTRLRPFGWTKVVLAVAQGVTDEL